MVTNETKTTTEVITTPPIIEEHDVIVSQFTEEIATLKMKNESLLEEYNDILVENRQLFEYVEELITDNFCILMSRQKINLSFLKYVNSKVQYMLSHVDKKTDYGMKQWVNFDEIATKECMWHLEENYKRA